MQRLDAATWDPHRRYAAVVDAVRSAAGADARAVAVFRVALGAARAEYCVVALDARHARLARLVGLKALAVES